MPTRKASRTKKTWKRRRDVHTKSLKNPFFKKKQPLASKIPWGKMSVFLFCFDLIFLVYFFVYSPYFKINSFEVFGTDIDITESIRGILHKQLNSHRFLLFPQDSIWLFNKKEAQDHIASLLSYETITIDIHNKILTVVIKQRDGALKWVVNNNIYLLDENGVALRLLEDQHIPIESSLPETPARYTTSMILERDSEVLIYDNSNTDVVIGNNIVDKDYVDKILFLNKTFSAVIEEPVSSFENLHLQTGQVKLNTTSGWYILMNLGTTDDIERDILRLEVLLHDKFKEDVTRLEYVDLRNGDKIFYK